MFKRIEPKSDEEWLAIRRKILTATDMGAILGLNRYTSVKEIIARKESYNTLDNSYIWLGRALEPIVVQAVNKVLGTKYELFEGNAIFVNEKVGLGATPDAGDGKVLLECKSTKPHNALKWAYWPPAYYLIQLYTQMIACERDEGILAILGTNLNQRTEVLKLPLSIFKIKRNKDIDNIIYKEVARFWDCQRIGKMYRVDRKQSCMLECKLYCLIDKVY